MQTTTLLSYLDGLYGYAMALSRNPAEAADLVQETCFRALKAQDKLRPSSNLKSWLFTILRNIWFNQLRHQRSAPQIAQLDPEENLEDFLVANSDNPHDLYVKKQEQKRVRTAIAKLPDEFREIIVLREYEDLSYQEIADVLKCPTGTVMSRLARARSKLGVLLSGLERSPIEEPTNDL